MDSKKKKKVVISIVCIAVIVIAAVITGVVLGVRGASNNNSNQNASNMGTVTDTNTYNTAIAEGKIPANYNGVYQFDRIGPIDWSKELTQKDIEKVCINKTSKPNQNDLLYALQKEREELCDSTDEKLVFINGLFNRNHKDSSGNIVTEHGNYVGNDNLSMVTTENEIFFISLNYTDINNNAPVSSTQNKDKTEIYIIERVYSKENPKRLLFNITYVYKLLPEEIKTIPDSELYF